MLACISSASAPCSPLSDSSLIEEQNAVCSEYNGCPIASAHWIGGSNPFSTHDLDAEMSDNRRRILCWHHYWL